MNMGQPQDQALSRFIITLAVAAVQTVVAVSKAQVSQSVVGVSVQEVIAVPKQMTCLLLEVKVDKATRPC